MHTIYLKKNNDSTSPFLWYPLRTTSQFSVSASRSPCVSAANKALITRYTLLLVYSLLYVLTISWCVLFHYAPSHSLSLSSFVSRRSFRSFIRPRLLCTRGSRRKTVALREARIETSLLLRGRFPSVCDSRDSGSSWISLAAKINFHEIAFRTERA